MKMIFNEKVILYAIFFVTLTLIESNNAANIGKKQDAKCFLPKDPGPCRARLERFYYNAQTDTCEKFDFGGCMGNGNIFGFKQTCEEACKKSASAAAITTSSTIANTAATSTTIAKPADGRTTSNTVTKVVTATAQNSRQF